MIHFQQKLSVVALTGAIIGLGCLCLKCSYNNPIATELEDETSLPSSSSSSDWGKEDSLIASLGADSSHLQVGRLLTSANYQAFCLATLIGPRTVLTAAHCRELEPIGPYIFQIDGKNYSAEKITPYFSFDEGDLTHDIALLTLDAPITDISPVKLSLVPPAKNWPVQAVRVDLLSGAKQQQSTKISSVAETTFKYRSSFSPPKNELGLGAPNFTTNTSGEEVLVGVQSLSRRGWGTDTRVDAYGQWIRVTTNGDVPLSPLPDVAAGIAASALRISPLGQDGRTIAGAVKLEIEVTSDAGVSTVMFTAACGQEEYILDIAFRADPGTNIFNGEWNTINFLDGACTVTAKITDKGRRTAEAKMDVTILNAK